DFLGAAAKASPAEVWKAYEEKHHTREAEIVGLKGGDYRPTAQTATDDEVKSYFDANRDLFDDARRVDLEFVAAKFDRAKVEVGTPADAELKDYYEKKKESLWRETAPVGTATVAGVGSWKPFEKVKAEVALKLIDEKTKDRANALVEKVSQKLAAQAKAKQPWNLAAACDEVKKAEKTEALVSGNTGLVEEDAVAEHGVNRSLATL